MVHHRQLGRFRADDRGGGAGARRPGGGDGAQSRHAGRSGGRRGGSRHRLAARRDEARPDRRRRGPGGGVGRDRRAGEQCRLWLHQRHRGGERCRGARPVRNQLLRPGRADPGRAAGDARAAIRLRHQPVLDRRHRGQCRHRLLFGHQVRGGGADRITGEGRRAARHPGDDRGAGRVPHRFCRPLDPCRRRRHRGLCRGDFPQGDAGGL